MIKKYLLVLFIFSSLHLFSQTNYIQYTVKDGLPQMQCMKIIQDHKGYIWIGTKWGLSKYDGIAFKNYFIDGGLSDNRIIDIKEGKNGIIWILTQDGLSSLKGDDITLYPTKKEFLFKDDHVLIDPRSKNTIWIIEGYFNKRLIKFSNGIYETKYTSKSGNIKGLSFDDKEKKIIFSETSLAKTKVFSYKGDTLKTERLVDDHRFILRHHDQLAIKSKSKETNIYKLTQKDTLPLFQLDKRVDIIKRLNDSTIIFSTSKYSPRMPVNILIHNKLLKTSNYFDQINDLLQDNEGNIWVASETGLFKIVPFHNYSEKENMPGYVWSVQEDRSQNIWFASYSSNYLYYLKRGIIKKHPEKFSNTAFFMGGIQTQNGHNYFTTNSGVVVYDENSFSNLDLPEKEAVLSIYEDTTSSNQYFGSYKGLFVKNKLGQYLHNKNFVKGKEEVVLKIVKNKKGELWFITKKSFGKINKSGDIIYKNENINSGLSIYADTRGNLWIGTKNNFYFYDYHNMISIQHPELKYMIGSVIGTSDNQITYGGLRGIGMLDLEEFYQIYNKVKASFPKVINAENFVTYYSSSHGFLGEEVGQNAMFKDSKNRIWIPTNTNVVMFDPKDLKKNTKAPKTYITNLESSNDNINWTKLNSVEKLHHTRNNIRIDYVGISHTAPKEVKYQYRLIGFSNEWVNATKDRQVTYTNLDPGNYTFELKASSNNNIWTKETIISSFEIRSAYWKTLWFQIICLVLIIVVIYLTITFFYHQRKRKIEFSERLNTLQMKAVQSQLYPHLLFNAASATGSVIYKENKDKAYDFVVKLSQLMRRALVDNQKAYKNLQDELDFVKNYLEIQKIRFSERFDYTINIDSSVNMDLEVPQMVVQTYVENAIKHGLEPLRKGGLLTIDILAKKNGIEIVIQDNGVGITEAKKNAREGTRSGIKIMNEIYQMHNENSSTRINVTLIDLYKKEEKGTKVIIDFNLK